jgi:hypothetical protein
VSDVCTVRESNPRLLIWLGFYHNVKSEVNVRIYTIWVTDSVKPGGHIGAVNDGGQKEII